MTSSDSNSRSGPKPAPKGAIRNVPAPQGTKATSVYGRFIPREELSDFSAWSPGAFGEIGQAAPALGVSRPPPPAPPQPDPEQALQSLMQATRQQAYQDGYRDGLAALEGFKQTHARQLSAQIGALVQSIGTQLDGLQQAMAEALAQSATNLARQMVRAELNSRPELVARLAGEALDTLLLSARHVTVRVHPDDLPIVQEGAAEVLSARGARLIADPAIARGGCQIDSDIGAVDATMHTRWSRAVAVLGSNAPWTDEPAATAERKDTDE